MIPKKNNGLISQEIIQSNKYLKPLVSIITVVRNGEKSIERTINSIINQTYKNIEYIIIDGASTDNTLKIISQYEAQISYWISEPDHGISDAFNKGISYSNGDIIGIVNSDDWLELNAVEIIVNAMNDKYSIYCGNLNLYDENLKLLKRRKSRTYLLPFGMYVMHPTVFIRKDLYLNDKFDTKFKIAMDYDLLLRLQKKGNKIRNIDSIISNMSIGGVSCNVKEMRIEEKIIMRYNLPFWLYMIARLKLIVEIIIIKIVNYKKW